jgi:hypothetical protein
MKHPLQTEVVAKSRSRVRTPEDYWQTLDPNLRDSFTPEQRTAVHTLLEAAIPRPAPKLVDLRFSVDALISRFYVVLLIGKDRRRQQRTYLPESVAQIGNVIAAAVLLIGLNLLVSLVIFLLAYLVKSAAGIDLVPNGHLVDQLNRLD